MRFIVGIDEVGRGPLAGPVSIGVVVCKTLLVLPELTDSKRMSQSQRERVAVLAQNLQKTGEIMFGVFSASAHIIDSIGIEAALRKIIAQGLSELAPDSSKVEIVLDGRLHAPKQYRQQTIIHGDFLIPAISLAAVIAKVTRDRYMVQNAAKKFPAYGFERHKGYGTIEHIKTIKKLGATPIHRMTFLSSIANVSMCV